MLATAVSAAIRRCWIGSLAAAVGIGCIACGGGHVPLPVLSPSDLGDTTGLAARGEYIVRNVAVCGRCHAADPKKDPDGALSGGFAFRNWRLGTVRAANITPDPETGIGAWSDAEVLRAIRNGEDRDGELLAPAMPYEWFHEMSDRDVLAVVRYLKSQPPVRHEVRNNKNLVYAVAEVFILKPVTNPKRIGSVPRGPTPEYGRYLANYVALCADCHTPRGGLQLSLKRDRLFAGNPDPPKGFPGKTANLTPDSATGIGKWSEQDFLRTLRTGKDPAGDTLNAYMRWREFKRMTDDDLRSIYRYLRTVPAINNRIPRQ